VAPPTNPSKATSVIQSSTFDIPDLSEEMPVTPTDQVEDAEDAEGDSDTECIDLTKQEWKPEVGLTFDSLEEAETKIKKWARSTGFELRRGHSKVGKENLRMLDLLCFYLQC
jgi:hypothetical protein